MLGRGPDGSDGPRRRERQRLLFPLHDPKPRPLPKIDLDEATALICREWRLPDGQPILEETAWSWASDFLRHLRYEPGPLWSKPRLRRRPERPTAKRLNEFLSVETDWLHTGG
jgi:hypothetical protein